jgi:hypothetical protein
MGTGFRARWCGDRKEPYFYRLLTITNGLNGSRNFGGDVQGLVKVDGTFV